MVKRNALVRREYIDGLQPCSISLPVHTLSLYCTFPLQFGSKHQCLKICGHSPFCHGDENHQGLVQKIFFFFFFFFGGGVRRTLAYCKE